MIPAMDSCLHFFKIKIQADHLNKNPARFFQSRQGFAKSGRANRTRVRESFYQKWRLAKAWPEP
jgi:hypothetical protein